MKNLEFPITSTKIKGLEKCFDLASPKGRKAYFNAKTGGEIKFIKKYLKDRTFIAYFLGKKNSGKGTYSKLFTEIFGEEKVAHVSVGDMVREYSEKWDKKFTKSAEYQNIKKLYRGFVSFEEAEKRLLGRSTQGALLPTEFILALLKNYISQHEGKSIFIDGLPRDMDQVSYSLYFRDLINYRDDPDLFILIDIPESIIAERIKYRVICPKCHISRSPKFFLTSKIDYDEKRKEFSLLCDNPECPGAVKMVAKEGDELGIEPIRPRLEKDEEILRKVFELHGVPKVLLRNHVPVSDAKKYFDMYEMTVEYDFGWDAQNNKVKVSEKPWIVKDDNEVPSYSLQAPPVVVGLIKQLAEVLEFEV